MPPSGKRVRAPPAGADVLMHTDDVSSDEEGFADNTRGAVPHEWYDSYEHVGYDPLGRRIGKGAAGDGISRFLKSQDDPLHRWTLYDEENNEEVVLSKRDVQLLRNMVVRGTVAHPEFDPTSPAYNLTDMYSDNLEIHPLNSSDEPKRRFIPSKWEVRSCAATAGRTRCPL